MLDHCGEVLEIAFPDATREVVGPLIEQHLAPQAALLADDVIAIPKLLAAHSLSAAVRGHPNHSIHPIVQGSAERSPHPGKTTFRCTSPLLATSRALLHRQTVHSQ